MIIIENNNRINVGLIINNIYNDYSALLCKGAGIAAEEYDLNLLIVPGREINAKWKNVDLSEYEYQNNVLYSYISEKNIDVLLISMGIIGFFLDSEQTKQFLDQYSGMKLIIMESELDSYPHIVYGLDGLKETIEHIVCRHGKRKVAFVSGPKDLAIADKRLNVYKEVLRENGIEYNEKYVVYADFTEFCEGEIRELLDRNADDMPEAICFGNDSMVLAAYKVFEERGIKPGKDILITGFDDAEFSSVIEPPLTTVKSSIMSMGYHSVEMAVKYYKNGHVENQYVSSSLVIRQSCGCNAGNNDELDYDELKIDLPRNVLINNIKKYIAKNSAIDIIPRSQEKTLDDLLNLIIDKIVISNNFDIKINEYVSDLMTHNNISYLTLDTINSMIYILKQIALRNSFSKEKSIMIYSAFEMMYKHISGYYAEKYLNNEKETVTDLSVFSKLANDMMANGKNEEKCFSLLMHNVSNINFKSIYIYIYEKSILNTATKHLSAKWERPENIYLKAFCEDKICTVPFQEEQVIASEKFMDNSFTSKKRRKTMILEALYFNEEQYGILLVETEFNRLTNIDNICKQICTSIKLTRFMNLLEGALLEVKKANAILSHESVSDQLTGVFNRRGFLIESEKILEKYKNKDCTGAVIFADLDNLKIINDSFGHDDGDFAIKKAASILKDNLRVSDIVGRIGGDEFVAFIVDIDNSQVNSICTRIKKYAQNFNKHSNKPYNVDISMGVYCFNSMDNETIDQLMTNADRRLYENKKHKNQTPIKNQVDLLNDRRH